MQAENKPEKLGKIVRLKLSEQVLERLRDMIVSGELTSGDKVPSERTLMEKFGVGRPAVREALQSLHTQGLITITHGERSRVNELSAQMVLSQSDDVARLLLAAAPANLEHLKEARRMFELGIVRAAAIKANEDDIETLRELLREQEKHLLQSKDIKMFIEADMRFHTGIADVLENPVITAASGAMLGWLLEYHASLLHWSGHEKITLTEHDLIVDAMAANDADAAVAAMETHLGRSQTLYNAKAPGT